MKCKFDNVAIVGATGAVGKELINCLDKLNFPLKSLKLLASSRSKGQTIKFREKSIVIDELNDKSFSDCDLVFFAATTNVSKSYAHLAVKAGALVIDNSSAYRMHIDVPLVIPEINPQAAFQHKGIIANPNCSTIIGITPLWQIHKYNPIQRLIISTYQAASGAGAEAMRELLESTRAYLNGKQYIPEILPHPYAFNLFSHNSVVDPNTLYNEEETKISKETKKIFNDENILISATCIRVPVLRAHAESITFTCENPISVQEARSLIGRAESVEIIDDIEKGIFPMPSLTTGNYKIHVGRIRPDTSDSTGKSISLFLTGDQLLKGAALNSVQISQLFL